MKQVILDTNAVRYFYQIECCNGEGVRHKVMRKYYFDKQKYIQFMRTVSSISIPATTKFELFFQAYRKGEPDLLIKYNDLTQHYKEAYGIDIYIINPGVPELKYHQEQLAEDLKNGLIQTEKYISPRIEHEVKLMQSLFLTLIGTISDVVYKDLEIEESVAECGFGVIVSQMYSKIYNLYKQYYLNKELHMGLDDVDKRIDEILLESIREAFIFMNEHMNKEHPKNAIEEAKVLYNASCTSEYLRVLLQIGTKYTQDDYRISLDKTLNELRLEKDFAETEMEYFRYLLYDIFNGTKMIIHKNDIADYTIITLLNEKVTLRVLEGNGKKEELKLVTFDKKMYEFSKKNNVMYDEEIYNQFLTEIK